MERRGVKARFLLIGNIFLVSQAAHFASDNCISQNNKHRKEFVSNCHSRLLLLLLLLLSSLSKKRTHRSFYDYFARRLSKRRSRRIFLRLSTGQRNALNLILHRAWPGRFDEFAVLSLLLTYPRNTLRDNTGTIPLSNRSNGTHDSSRLNVIASLRQSDSIDFLWKIRILENILVQQWRYKSHENSRAFSNELELFPRAILLLTQIAEYFVRSKCGLRFSQTISSSNTRNGFFSKCKLKTLSTDETSTVSIAEIKKLFVRSTKLASSLSEIFFLPFSLFLSFFFKVSIRYNLQ